MAEDSLISEETRAMIGKESSPRIIGEVYQRDIRRFAVATNDTNRLYFDEEYAKKSGYGGIIAPPSFIFTFFYDQGHGPDAEISEDGLVRSGDGDELRISLSVKRVMGAGSELEFFQPLRPGDVISAKRKILDIYEREGKSGKIVFIIRETTYTNQRGEVVVTEKGTSMAR